MKKTLTTLLIVASISSTAQTVTLPAKVTITLTDRQFLKIDSAVKFTETSIDSKSLTKFILEAFAPLYNQVKEQSVADKPKEQKEVKKP